MCLLDAFVDVVDCIADIWSVAWVLLERGSRLLEMEGRFGSQPEHVRVQIGPVRHEEQLPTRKKINQSKNMFCV